MRIKPTEGDVHCALRVIVRHTNHPALNYCVNYARMGLSMYGNDLKVQILYILNNMTHWRGTDATYVRQILKLFAGVK